MKESRYSDLLSRSHSFPNQHNCFCSSVGTELSFISYLDDLQYQWLSVVSVFGRLISTVDFTIDTHWTDLTDSRPDRFLLLICSVLVFSSRLSAVD